jgi:parallel beta-helix repeat protein
MRLKAVSGIMLTLLLTGMLTLAFNIQPAEAESTTWIVDDDGPADFSSIQQAINSPDVKDGDTIFVYNGTYYENVVISKALSLVGENPINTIIDGDKTGTVVYITADNVSISGFTIRNSGSGDVPRLFSGIYLEKNFRHSIIEDNIISYNYWGVFLFESSGNTVSENTIRNNQHGIYLSWSSNNTIIGNNITNNSGYGIHLYSSGDNYLRNNNMTGNGSNFGVSGILLSYFTNDIDNSNMVNGKPIYYWVNQHNKQVPVDAGYVAVVNCTNITVKDVNFANNWHGVLFVYTTGSFITNVNASNNRYGIYLYQSNGTTIVGNTVSNGWAGILLASSGNNTIFHNNFMYNQQYQVFLAYDDGTNKWDNGYPSGGNYWSDYTGVDLYSGPYQNETGSDGIGDTPYVIDANNIDHYPLMKPFPWDPHDLGITNLAIPKSAVWQGFDLRINVTVFNYGNNTENFDVTVYADTTIIDTTIGITLASGISTTITFTWNTTGFAIGNYTIGANISVVLGETDAADNTYTDGWVEVRLWGDVNGDDKVSLIDIGKLDLIYSGIITPPYYPQYMPDINDDGVVSLADVGKLDLIYSGVL